MNEEETGTFVKAMQDNAGRLGLTWELRQATVTSTSPFKVKFDNDESSHVIDSILEVRPLEGDRVYVASIPPAGNYAIGYITAITGRFIDANWMIAGGVPAQSLVLGTEVAVPSVSWASEPTFIFKTGRAYNLVVQYAPYMPTNAGPTYGHFIVRRGAASVAGTPLWRAYHQVPATFQNLAKTEVGVGWVKNYSGVDVATKLSLSVAWTVIPPGAVAAGLGVYGGDAITPTYVAVYEISNVPTAALAMMIQI